MMVMQEVHLLFTVVDLALRSNQYLDHDCLRESLSLVNKLMRRVIIRSTQKLTLDPRVYYSNNSKADSPFLQMLKPTVKIPLYTHHMLNITEFRILSCGFQYYENSGHNCEKLRFHKPVSIDIAWFNQLKFLQSVILCDATKKIQRQPKIDIPWIFRKSQSGSSLSGAERINCSNDIKNMLPDFSQFMFLSKIVMSLGKNISADTIKFPPTLTHLDLNAKIGESSLFTKLWHVGIRKMSFLSVIFSNCSDTDDVVTYTTPIEVDHLYFLSKSSSGTKSLAFFIALKSLVSSVLQPFLQSQSNQITSYKIKKPVVVEDVTYSIFNDLPKLTCLKLRSSSEMTPSENCQINIPKSLTKLNIDSFGHHIPLHPIVGGENITSLKVSYPLVVNLRNLPQNLKYLDINTDSYVDVKQLPVSLANLSIRLAPPYVENYKTLPLKGFSHLKNVHTFKCDDTYLLSFSSFPPNVINLLLFNIERLSILRYLYRNITVKYPYLKRLGLPFHSKNMYDPKAIKSVLAYPIHTRIVALALNNFDPSCEENFPGFMATLERNGFNRNKPEHRKKIDFSHIISRSVLECNHSYYSFWKEPVPPTSSTKKRSFSEMTSMHWDYNEDDDAKYFTQ